MAEPGSKIDDGASLTTGEGSSVTTTLSSAGPQQPSVVLAKVTVVGPSALKANDFETQPMAACVAPVVSKLKLCVLTEAPLVVVAVSVLMTGPESGFPAMANCSVCAPGSVETTWLIVPGDNR